MQTLGKQSFTGERVIGVGDAFEGACPTVLNGCSMHERREEVLSVDRAETCGDSWGVGQRACFPGDGIGNPTEGFYGILSDVHLYE
jgi:hypothetical protein